MSDRFRVGAFAALFVFLFGWAGLALGGCAALAAAGPTITTVIAIATSASSVIAQVSAFAREYFALHPDAAKEAEVQHALAKAAAAARLIADLGNGVEAVDQKLLVAALVDFQAAYADLLGIIGKLPGVGVSPSVDAGKVALSAHGSTLVVPTPASFAPRTR